MDTEIKLEQNPIKQAVSTLKTSTQHIEADFPEETKGENELTIMEQLVQLNKTYANLLESYQTLLQKHVQMTEKSVDTLVETDETIANQLPVLK